MLSSIDLADNTPAPSGGGGGIDTTYQPRHNRYEIISTPASTGTLTLAEGVSICDGYEAYAEVYEYSAQFGIMGPLIATNDPFPIPYSIPVNPATGEWTIINPISGQPATPLTSFAIVYKCKIPLADWDESAPLYR